MTTSEREPTRKKVSELEVGDVALHLQFLAPTSGKVPLYSTITVTNVTAKLVIVGRKGEFYRDTGLPRFKDVRGRLVDATDEHVTAWRTHLSEMEKRQKAREDERFRKDQENRKKALAAAQWLASSNAETIYQKMQLYELVELYDDLNKEGLISDPHPEDRPA